MTKGKKLGLGIFVLIVAAVIAAIVWPKDTSPTLETVLASKGSVVQTVDLTGNVRYPETRRAAFLMSGYVDRVHVNLGETVEQGQLLATLRDSSGATQLSDAQKSMLRLTAPIAGVVTSMDAYSGEIVSAGMPVITLSGPVAMFEVLVSASENDVAKLTEGDNATIVVDALDQEFSGEVEQIAPVAQSAQGVVTYAVVILIDRAAIMGKGAWSGMRAGMTADVRVVTAEADNAVYVPRRAVISHDNKEYVRVVADNEEGYEEREVTTGLRGEDGDVVILTGVAEGDEIVLKIVE